MRTLEQLRNEIMALPTDQQKTWVDALEPGERELLETYFHNAVNEVMRFWNQIQADMVATGRASVNDYISGIKRESQ